MHITSDLNYLLHILKSKEKVYYFSFILFVIFTCTSEVTGDDLMLTKAPPMHTGLRGKGKGIIVISVPTNLYFYTLAYAHTQSLMILILYRHVLKPLHMYC